MIKHRRFGGCVVTAFVAGWLFLFGLGENSHLLAQDQTLDELMEQLSDPELEDWEPVERQIWELWSLSGSDALDLLLRRGRDAMELGDFNEAIAHFTAVIDHSPEFAEGWNARATAFYFAGQFGQSMADIERVLALNPDHFGALTGMAMILEETGKSAEALVVVRRVLEVHPHRPDVLMARDRLEAETEGSAL
ncbi:MAG: tetratricopeptide repeat protein [Pseudomonadota bacterium]